PLPSELTAHPPPKPTALLPRPPTPPALVRRPIASPRKPMPLKAPARGSGTLVPVRRNEALCASLTSISIAVTATKRRARSHARSNARPSIRSRCLRDAERRHGYPGRPHPAGVFFWSSAVNACWSGSRSLTLHRGDRDEDAARRSCGAGRLCAASYSASGVGLSRGGSIWNVAAVRHVMEKLPTAATRATRLSSPITFSAVA